MPDLTCLGKIIGGGLPVGAFGGRREIMEMLAPVGPVYQAGTLSGNPLAMATGIAMLKRLSDRNFYLKLEEKSKHFETRINDLLKKYHKDFAFNRIASMWTLFFKTGSVISYEDAMKSDVQLYAKYFGAMLEEGIYLAPSQFEAGFISEAHHDIDIDATIEKMDVVFSKIFL